jgi:NADH:ubiquinone oxidoreductase subunit H
MTEHSAVIFVFFFLAEYASIVLICILSSLFFYGGYLECIPLVTIIFENIMLLGLISGLNLGIKTCLLIFVFI